MTRVHGLGKQQKRAESQGLAAPDAAEVARRLTLKNLTLVGRQGNCGRCER